MVVAETGETVIWPQASMPPSRAVGTGVVRLPVSPGGVTCTEVPAVALDCAQVPATQETTKKALPPGGNEIVLTWRVAGKKYPLGAWITCVGVGW
jgi:hypothetical protein